MHSYAAFLGHQPRISIAELAATIPDFSFQRIIGKNVALFSSAKELGQKDLQQWGGIFLLARQIATDNVTLDDVPNLLQKELSGIRGKVTFALRAIGASKPKIRDLYRKSKDLLKKQGKASRYVGHERIPAASALLRDAGLIPSSGSGQAAHGAELVILQEQSDDDEFLWIGRTVAAQDPDAYTKRDMQKPVRDTRAGLLPPKLAQVMLNFGVWLASKEKTKSPVPSSQSLVVYDPFCGTGVIPMESLLRGFKTLGSDVALKAVNGCEKNLEWLRKQEDIKKRDVPSDIWKQDALKPFDIKEHPALKEVSVIVSESHLGPALTGRPNAKEAAKLRTENEAMQIAFLKSIAAHLPGVPVVITWPVWYLKTGPLFLEKVWKALPDLGFTPMLPPYVEPDIADHFSLLYRRPEQLVGREIVMLKPRK